MLNSEKAMFAMNDIDDVHLESARIRLGYQTGGSTRPVVKKRMITFALAAALILGLSAVGYAIYRATMYTRVPEEGKQSIMFFTRKIRKLHRNCCTSTLIKRNWL